MVKYYFVNLEQNWQIKTVNFSTPIPDNPELTIEN
jgi:hypothetical protein